MPLAVGDYVRIRLAGQVTALDATTLTVTSFDGTAVPFPAAIRDDRGFAWEQVSAPEPAYQVGCLYEDAGGDVFERTDAQQPGDQWRVAKSETLPPGQYVHHDTPTRPLKRLIPEP